MKYLVTGGAGFIGSHIVTALIERGESVRILDNLSTGKKDNLAHIFNKVEFIEGDIRDANTVRQAVSGIDYVLHQAALRSVPRSMELPWEYNDVNINGTLNLLIAARDAKVKRLVFASSSSVYGNAEKLPQSESDPVNPISPYALTKLVGEKYCRLFSESYGLETVSLRYFNVFGPRQGLDNDYAVVIPKFITCMLNGNQPPIYGDGAQSRDFTFVANVVEANLLACEAKNTHGEVYNAAAGEGKTVLQLVDELNKLMGTKIRPLFHPPRHGDVKHTLAASVKIREHLKWPCRITFIDGLKKTVEAFRQA